MKPFELTKKMLTIGGVFYPTGHAFIMLPTEAEGQQVAGELGAAADQAMLLDPKTVLRDIGKVDGDDDSAMPDVGTESATVMKYIALARQGHHALMIPVDGDEEKERLMVAVRKTGCSYAQLYHMLAMEDLI
ncbi:MAG: RNA-binding protein [Polaromonas sp.]|nr:RNA-binding protein [Polaromonas sp.]